MKRTVCACDGQNHRVCRQGTELVQWVAETALDAILLDRLRAVTEGADAAVVLTTVVEVLERYQRSD